MHSFWSDNAAPVHPRYLRALAECNDGHAAAYGDDPYTLRAENAMRALFGPKCEAIFVMNGTGANVVALSPLLDRYGSVLCAETAHINTHETGAPCSMLGAMLVPIATSDGKLTPSLLESAAACIGDRHCAQPQCVEIAQITELGTVYTAAEVRALADFCHVRGMRLMMDGARISNAAAALGAPVPSFTSEAGVDALVFGGTKNGLMFGECVLCFDSALADKYRYLRKNLGQLDSKMRYISVQFEAYIAEGLYLETAAHANAMAARLADGLRALGAKFAQEPQANILLVCMDEADMLTLSQTQRFHPNGPGVVRFVTSFDTTEDDVDALIADFARLR